MFKREETYSVGEFMERNREPIGERKTHIPFLTGVSLPFTLPVLASAHERTNIDGIPVNEAVTVNATTQVTAQADIYAKVIEAFDPIIVMLQAFAYPIATLVVLGGALYIMIGNKEKGFGLMQGAGLGYILVQMAPLFLNILQNSVKAVA